MKMLNDASGMSLPFLSEIGIVGFLLRLIQTNVLSNASDLNNCSKTTIKMSMDTKKSSSVIALWNMLVFFVGAGIYISQVAQSVIRRISVYMVYLVVWPFTVRIKPSKSVRVQSDIINFYQDVPACIFASSPYPGLYVTHAHFPRKNPSFLVVMQNFTQAFSGKRRIQFSHDALQKLIGQVPEYAANIFGFRHYTISAEA